MSHPFDVQSILERDYAPHFADHPDEMYSVELADGRIGIAAKWLFFNISMWKPLVKRGLPITKRHLFHNEFLDSKSISRICTEILDDVTVLPLQPGQHPDEWRGFIYDYDILLDLALVINEIYNNTVVHLSPYHRTMSIFDIAETLAQPEVKELVSLNVANELSQGIDRVEQTIRKKYDQLNAVFKTDTFAVNAFRPFLALGALSTAQFPQVVTAAGTRTDVNDTMIRIPIQSSYTRGFQNIQEYVIDALAARKSLYYNDVAMRSTQYSNRKQQLMASAISVVYPGDCGAEPIPFFITPEVATSTIGKVIIVGTKKIVIKNTNIDKYVNTQVLMRSGTMCRHTNGICHVCGGMVLRNLVPTISPGLIAAVETMSPVAQKVLSSKHFSVTKTRRYVVADGLREIFEVRRNEIVFKEKFSHEDYLYGFHMDDIVRIRDLEELGDIGSSDPDGYNEEAINDAYYTALTAIVFIDRETGEVRGQPANLVDPMKTIPYLSTEVLEMILEEPERMQTHGDIVWIDVKGLPKHKPFMRYTVINNSTKEVAAKITRLLTHDIANFTSVPEAMRRITEIVYKDVSPHLMHVETIVKAAMITSLDDYSVPIVTDMNNVRFAPLAKIIPRRSIGAQIAFERYKDYHTSPVTYTVPKEVGPFDAALSPAD